LIPIIEHRAACDPPFTTARLEHIKVAPADHSIMFIAATIMNPVIGYDLGFDLCCHRFEFDIALADMMLRVGYGFRAGYDPSEIFVKRAFENAVISDRIGPLGGGNQRRIAPVFAARKACNTSADLFAGEHLF
jgi:hypothetical protein